MAHRVREQPFLSGGDDVVNLQRREDFLTIAALFMCGLLLLTWWLGWWLDISPFPFLQWSWADIAWGGAGGVAMLGAFALFSGPRDEAEELMGEVLAQCRWHDFLFLALSAGVVEELLFRGTLEPWLARWNPWVALLIANAAFGLLHAVSWTYALVAMGLGCLLSLLAQGWGSPNLLRPIVAHAVYDYIGFFLIARAWRLEHPLGDLPDPTFPDEDNGR